MRTRLSLGLLLLGLAALFVLGCDLPGRPAAGPEVPRPDEVLAFDQLYRQNCSSCHGANGKDGAATNLSNPEYGEWVDDASLRRVIEKGEKGSLMPAFALSHGGTLTEAQVDVLVQGMRANWAKANFLQGAQPPPYHAVRTGVVSQGQAVYLTACARCHGATAQQPGVAGSILDASFLSLMNARTLRTAIVAGRPDIGQPDWRNDVPGHELTDAEVTDVTAWLIAQKPSNAGKPLVDEQPGSGRPAELETPGVRQ